MLGRYRSKPAATALRQVFGLVSLADEPAPARQSLALGLGRRELRDREAVAPLQRAASLERIQKLAEIRTFQLGPRRFSSGFPVVRLRPVLLRRIEFFVGPQ